MHPHIQTKAYEEVAGLVFSPDQEITIELMKDLHYLECVLKEAMRLMPVAPIVGRQSRAELVLDGHRIPPGSVFLFHFYALHRRKDVWGPTADEFEPGRFLADGGRHPYAHHHHIPLRTWKLAKNNV